MTKTNLTIIIILLSLFVTQTSANILVLNGLTHKYKTLKGNTYRGSIELQNIGNSTKRVKLYLQDVTYNSSGITNYTEAGTHKLSNSEWLTFNTNYVEIPPNEKVDILYEIKIPDHVNTEGSYWTTCMVEPVDEIIPNKESKGLQVQSIIRYAIQIITDYTIHPISPKIIFESINLEQDNKLKNLNIALVNEGQIYCEPEISLEIYDTREHRKIEGNFNSSTMSLLPQTSKIFTIDISSLPPNKYKAIAFAKDKDDHVFALEFDLNVEK